MSRPPGVRGDFGLPRDPVSKQQVVGIYDLVGFTKHVSNEDLITAVSTMELQVKLVVSPKYYWDERKKRIDQEGTENQVLVRSTGDGYFIAFSHDLEDIDVLHVLTRLYQRIRQNHPVRLGINKGDNYVVADLNKRVNIIGVGINHAARALQFAEKDQIICTSQFAQSLLDAHGDQITKEIMQDLGVQHMKHDELNLYNYHKDEEFGAPLTPDQRKDVKSKKKKRKTTKKN